MCNCFVPACARPARLHPAGGIALNGAFFNDGIVNPVNKTNTYLNLKFACTNNGWCYLDRLVAIILIN
jgi:hypothetical protein